MPLKSKMPEKTPGKLKLPGAKPRGPLQAPQAPRLTNTEVNAAARALRAHPFPVLVRADHGFRFDGDSQIRTNGRVTLPLEAGGKSYTLCITTRTPTHFDLCALVRTEIGAGRGQQLRDWTVHANTTQPTPDQWLTMPMQFGTGVHDPASRRYIPIGPQTFMVRLPPKLIRLKIANILRAMDLRRGGK